MCFTGTAANRPGCNYIVPVKNYAGDEKSKNVKMYSPPFFFRSSDFAIIKYKFDLHVEFNNRNPGPCSCVLHSLLIFSLKHETGFSTMNQAARLLK